MTTHTTHTTTRFFGSWKQGMLCALAGLMLMATLPIVGCGGGGSGSGSAAGTQDPAQNPFPVGRLRLITANGSAVPHVVSSYYDQYLKLTWKMTVVGGDLELKPDGTFSIARTGGESRAPVTVKGNGTYAIDPDEKGLTLTYTEGSGPTRFNRTEDNRLLCSYVIKGGSLMIPDDIEVIERYRLD